MSLQRFIAPTAREALAQVRRALGPDAVVLSNRAVGREVEILAAGPEALDTLVERSHERSAGRGGARQARPDAVAAQPEPFTEYLKRRAREGAIGIVEADDDEVAALAPRPAVPMSSAPAATAPAAAPRAVLPMAEVPAAAPRRAARDELPVSTTDTVPAVFRRAPRPAVVAPTITPEPTLPPATPSAMPAATAPLPVAPVVAAAATPLSAAVAAPSGAAIAATAAIAASVAPAAATPTAPVMPNTLPSLAADPAIDAPAVTAIEQKLVAEIKAMRSALQAQLQALAAVDAMRRQPAQAQIMTRLLTAGFSADTARRIAQQAPQQADAESWLPAALAHNLKCAAAADDIVERGGVWALIGPTGVGKTTTTAKLAARCAVRYGAANLGLITLDTYRVGAHEQLRTYGRILGAPVFLAQDATTLREVLAALAGKKLVLIDTCGVSQRDPRLAELLALLDAAGTPQRPVQRALLLQAAAAAETLQEVATGWHAAQARGAILTKLDEAARIGGALDCVLRHKLPLLALTNGQRVPEDLHAAEARLLVHMALKPAHRLFEIDTEESTQLAHAAMLAGVADA